MRYAVRLLLSCRYSRNQLCLGCTVSQSKVEDNLKSNVVVLGGLQIR